MTRTPDSARGRVSATANAIFGGAQGASLLLGGAVAVVLSPRAIYAVAGLLGLAAAGIVAITHASRDSELAAPLGIRRATKSAHRVGQSAGSPERRLGAIPTKQAG